MTAVALESSDSHLLNSEELTLLANGTVLLAGGLAGPAHVSTDSVLIYDPDADQPFSPGRRLRQPRAFHTAELVEARILLFLGGGVAGDEEYRIPRARRIWEGWYARIEGVSERAKAWRRFLSTESIGD